MQKVQCPHCKASVQAPQLPGLTTTCTACGQRFVTPEAPQLEEIKLEPPVNLNPVLQNTVTNQPRRITPNSFSGQQSDQQLERIEDILEDILVYVRKIHFCLTFPPLIGGVVYVLYLVVSEWWASNPASAGMCFPPSAQRRLIQTHSQADASASSDRLDCLRQASAV